MRAAGASGSGSSGPSIRLSVGGSSKSAGTSPPASKKRRFVPPTSLRPQSSNVFGLELVHQQTSLSFVLDSASSSSPQWHAEGTTTLFVIDESQNNTITNTKTAANTPISLALHLRGTCEVQDVRMEALVGSAGTISSASTPHLTVLPQTSFQHFDPLERVLLKPATSYTIDDVLNTAPRHQADSQSSRGAVGMTNALRAASSATLLGGLKLSAIFPASATANTKATTASSSSTNLKALVPLMKCWRNELEAFTKVEPTIVANQNLEEQLQGRKMERREERLQCMSKKLAQAKHQAFKITIRYNILLGRESNLDQALHLGGIHALTNQHTPHIYTTAGVFGDHEGPSSWVPTLDSASTQHRASQQIRVTVTAPMKEGLSVLGFGEDLGATETLLHETLQHHYSNTTTEAIATTSTGISTEDYIRQLRADLGAAHTELLGKVAQRASEAAADQPDTPHLIPPDAFVISPNLISMDSILATTVWCSGTWLPVPARSMGFSIGPFRLLEDPEYFAPENDGSEEESTEDDSDSATRMESETKGELQKARDMGEGIRQAYFSPIFARKHIHAQAASTKLLPGTKIEVDPLTSHEQEIVDNLDQSVLTATVGVPNRSLSLMRDILAVPAFRTASYTQIWIPRAIHGGSSSGSLHSCPEVLVNAFAGGAIMDSRLLPPVGHRLPFHQGGRVLQFLQARCTIRGWITSAIPLGGRDDVGHGYIHCLIESLLMSLYERGHGAHGEGGGPGGVFFTKRFSIESGLNSSNLEFLPVQNIEDMDFDVVVGSVIGAVPVEDRNNDQLWRSATNGTESHTSAMDEFSVRELLTLDSVHALERGNDKDRFVPTPSLGWMGSHLSLSFLSSNANSSSHLGCGALELVHPTGGLPYRTLKASLLRKVVAGRAGMANFIRLIRAAFIAAHLEDLGETELRYPPASSSSSQKPATTETIKSAKVEDSSKSESKQKETEKNEIERIKPRFIVCVNELLKKKGLTHTLFTRALQNLAGKVRESQLLGTLVDVERHSKDPRTGRPFVDPEGFPNSYVRGASEVYLRVGVHVEPAKDTGTGLTKGIQLQSYAEPVIPEGGISFGGPITVRVVENEGQFREFVKDINVDGSRRDWGSLTLHAKPVTLPKAQTAASGIIESTSSTSAGGSVSGSAAGNARTGKSNEDTMTNQKDSKSGRGPSKQLFGAIASPKGVYSGNAIHRGGYQAIELIRLTNLTPLLWVRVDPMGLFCGKTSVFQPDACLAEMLFHDGDAGAQVESLRALAERPLRIQGSVKVNNIYDVKVSELPVRVLADCLRGSAALHSSLPHTPVVRAQAALAIAQWQNNKAPTTKNTLSANHWVGINLLIQYFKERFYNNGHVLPVKFNRVVLKKNDMEVAQAAPNSDGTPVTTVKSSDDSYSYLDSFEEGAEREVVLEEADEVEVEEDEEYRVRSAVITSIASIRAKDGMTPSSAIQFLETVLDSVDAEMVGNLVSPDEEVFIEKKRRKQTSETSKDNTEGEEKAETAGDLNDGVVSSMSHVSSMLVADALLALCHVNVSPALITDPKTGKPVQSSAAHPVTKLMETSRKWLEWELYREGIRKEMELESLSGISGVCYDTIAACAITSLSSLAILRQSTTDKEAASSSKKLESGESASREKARRDQLAEVATATFYVKIFDHKPYRSDVTRAACAQAIACISCAADRFENDEKKPVGLLTALEFIFERIVQPTTSPELRQTLAQLMLDACSGKVCSMQRVGAIGGRNDAVVSAGRFYNGPLGGSHGGDNGNASMATISQSTYPAANAVNDGARRGLRLLSRAGHPRETGVGEALIVRIARFATDLWRTINGEPLVLSDDAKGQYKGYRGVCANDGHLRCTLLALWQWCWPRGCFAVMQVQTWKSHEGTQHYKDIGADMVMKITAEEKEASNAEEASLGEIGRLVSMEIDRQLWRGEMAIKAYEFYKSGKTSGNRDAAAAEQGIGQPLPPIQRDSAYKAGGWIASAAQQRRALALDGGTAVTKLRLRKSGD